MNAYQNPNIFNSTPPVSRHILIINILICLACNVFKSLGFYLALFPVRSGYFHPYQLVTFMFTQTDFWHLAFNMFAVFMFGRVLENYWGVKKFLIYYMVCGIGSGLVQLLVCHLTGSYYPTIGASGAVFGILLAFGMLFPNAPLYLMFIPIPVKAKYLVIGYGLIELYMGFANRAGDNVAHFAHLGGMLFGLIMILYWKKKDNHNIRFFRLNLFNKIKKSTKKNEEIDRILDKIKKSGYNCLSEEEKKKLFDASNR